MVSVKSVPSPVIPSPAIAEERSHEADHPTSLLACFGADQPLKLDCGVDLKPFQIAYQTYGTLNAERSATSMSITPTP
jgi:homoserine O-acetyltransferase